MLARSMIRQQRLSPMILAGLMMAPLPSVAQTLNRDVAAAAGGTSAVGDLKLGFTVGESVVGGSNFISPDLNLVAGFWGPSGATAVDVGEDPDDPAEVAAFEPGLDIHPNPFAGGTMIRFRTPAISGDLSARGQIFDSSGRLVRTWVTASSHASVRMFAWDGLDQKGRAVPAGVYFCRLDHGSWSATRRLVRIR